VLTKGLLGVVRMAKTTLPNGFGITEGMRQWAETKAPQVDIDREHEAFCDYWLAHGTKMADWFATWRTWMRRAPQFRGAMRSQGFRRAFRHETSTTYTDAFRDWKQRDAPARDMSNILNIARAKRI